MAAPASDEARELSLVGKVEMRIALADTDAKLSTILKTFLAPLLLKLASEHSSVRNKVISICSHINTRIAPPTVSLPVAALVKQFKDQDHTFVRRFDLLYIQQGVPRLSAKEKAELLPMVMAGIARSGSNHASQIFYLFLRLLDSFVFPLRGSKEDLELRNTLGVDEEDVRFLGEKLGGFMLFNAVKGVTSPGLTPEEHAFFMVQGREDAWDARKGGLSLLTTKTHAVKICASGIFTDEERFLPALFASADMSSAVCGAGEDMLKRAVPVTDFEDGKLIRRLFELYFGKDAAPRVKAPLRLKILGLLGKSTVSTTFASEIARLVDDGVSTPAAQDGEDTIMTNGIQQPAVALGREATKLRAAIFTYINFVARYGDKQTLHDIAQQVINRLRDFIENQGWPKAGGYEDLVSRGYAYEVIGLLARAGPRSVLVEEDRPTFDLLRWLFTSLAKDASASSITVSIEESLSTVLHAMSRIVLATQEQEVLEGLLMDQMEQSDAPAAHGRFRSTRYVAVRLANRCLPFASVKARWIDALAAGAISDRPEVREEGERGLSPYWYRMLNGEHAGVSERLPQSADVAEIVQFFFVRQAAVTSEDPSLLVRQVRKQHDSSFEHLTRYARMTLIQQAFDAAGVKVNADSEWERRLDALVETDVKAREAVKKALVKIQADKPQVLDLVLCALFEMVTASSTTTTGGQDYLVEFLALSPQALIDRHVTRATALLPVLKVNNTTRRLIAAQAFGILVSNPDASAQLSSEVQGLLTQVEDWATAVGTRLISVHGAITALGYYFSRFSCRQGRPLASEEYLKFLGTVFKIFRESRDELLQSAVFIAIGQMAMFRCLEMKSLEGIMKIREVTDKLYEKAKTGNEDAILCLGQWSMILPESESGSEDDEKEEKEEKEGSELRYVELQLHKLHEIRQAEIHFTVGEAMSYLAAGWQSGALATKLDVDGPTPTSQPRTKTMPRLLEKILADCANTKPALKKAAVMWLLCLVQFCGDQPEVQSRLSKCQTAFRRCLADRDELVQESASRGLGLVYEKGDRRLKDDLVRELVSSFSSDKQQLAGNVSSDTQLFEPGALPTGDGSVSTYKDIMSLASEVGDSSLVYKFMSMASSNAIWSSRAAFGRFGLSNVLSDSSVDGYLANNPKLYPKLFRYRFDPNGGVQRSMNEIWNTLVPDSAATIDKYFDSIIQDLLVSILGKEWRVRQACCAAIADLVQGRPLERYEQYLERIWTQCFKVLDDIKESVRAAAGSLARTLTGVLTRTLEADHSSTKNASTMLRHVLPFLLSPSGMESSAQDVQMFSVHTLLEIIKKANGATIRSFIPELVERLIGLLSSLEPEAVNYVHLNAAKYNLTEQKIDDMRLSSVRSSPLMEAIERCLDLLDEETMKSLQPRLESAMKTAVGLPSKVGASRVLVSLSTRRMMLFQPYVDDTLRLLEKLVIDRNDTVASSYAAATGYLARGASDKQILRLIDYAKQLYFHSEGDREGVVPRRSITAGEIMFAFAKHASDRFNSFATASLPFVFVAKHDSHEQVKEHFQDTWNESVGGSRAVSLYLPEILALCMQHLDSPQWTLKHTSARAVSAAVMAVAATESQLSSASADVIWPALEKALGGKTWEGKEIVLLAFGKFVEVSRAYVVAQDNVKAMIVKIALREAKRQNASYRPHALRALARIAVALSDGGDDVADQVMDIVEAVLVSLTSTDDDNKLDPDAMEIDGKDNLRKAEELKESTLTGTVSAALGSVAVTAPSARVASQITRALRAVVAIPDKSPAVWRATYVGLKDLFDRVAKSAASRKDEVEMQSTPEMISHLRALTIEARIDIDAVKKSRDEAQAAIRAAAPEAYHQMMMIQQDPTIGQI